MWCRWWSIERYRTEVEMARKGEEDGEGGGGAKTITKNRGLRAQDLEHGSVL
jgi:hypothetical protein